MRKFGFILFIVAVLSINVAQSEEIIWVPITIDGITIFVPSNATPPSPPPPSPPPPNNPISDPGLLDCIGLIPLDEIISINCVAFEIKNLVGIEALVNLETFYIGHNLLTDISQLNGLNNLKTLGVSSYQETNQLLTAQIASIKGMDSIEDLDVYSYQGCSNRLQKSAFENGFTGLTFLRIRTLYNIESSLHAFLTTEYLPTAGRLIWGDTLQYNNNGTGDDPPFVNCPA